VVARLTITCCAVAIVLCFLVNWHANQGHLRRGSSCFLWCPNTIKPRHAWCCCCCWCLRCCLFVQELCGHCHPVDLTVRCLKWCHDRVTAAGVVMACNRSWTHRRGQQYLLELQGSYMRVWARIANSKRTPALLPWHDAMQTLDSSASNATRDTYGTSQSIPHTNT
jgi:hypothetical protein